MGRAKETVLDSEVPDEKRPENPAERRRRLEKSWNRGWKTVFRPLMRSTSSSRPRPYTTGGKGRRTPSADPAFRRGRAPAALFIIGAKFPHILAEPVRS